MALRPCAVLEDVVETVDDPAGYLRAGRATAAQASEGGYLTSTAVMFVCWVYADPLASSTLVICSLGALSGTTEVPVSGARDLADRIGVHGWVRLPAAFKGGW